MSLLLEIYLSMVRIILLAVSTLLVYVLGERIYLSINAALYQNSIPCLELLSTIIAFVPVVGLLYGVHIQKYFWQRVSHYNKLIFVISFVAGIVATLFPANTGTCVEQQTPIASIAHILSTGIIVSFFAFIGVDLGVSLKRASHHIQTNKKKYHGKTSKKR